MKYDYIIKAVQRLKDRFETTDLKQICRKLGILIIETPMGNSPNAIKGFFMNTSRIKSITINIDMPEAVQHYVLAHELGHAVLHGKKSVRSFHDRVLYDTSSITEKEANLFAAELLMEDKDVLMYLEGGSSFFETASIFGVPAEFLEFKLRVMRAKGFSIPEAPITACSQFLKDVPIPEKCGDIFA